MLFSYNLKFKPLKVLESTWQKYFENLCERVAYDLLSLFTRTSDSSLVGKYRMAPSGNPPKQFVWCVIGFGGALLRMYDSQFFDFLGLGGTDVFGPLPATMGNVPNRPS